MARQSNAEIASLFLSMVASGNVQEAFDSYVGSAFRHHNAQFPSDRQSLLAAMKQSAAAEPDKSFDIKQIVASADRVAVHSHLKRMEVGLEYAVVHILKFDEGKIVELWDIGQEIPQGSPNTLGMF